jgi:uncharacterized coiled-coil protein SlyX
MPSPADDPRFVSLEEKLAYLEKTTLDLNEVVVLQERRLERLERQLARLERELSNDEPENDPSHEPPPHY